MYLCAGRIEATGPMVPTSVNHIEELAHFNGHIYIHLEDASQEILE